MLGVYISKADKEQTGHRTVILVHEVTSSVSVKSGSTCIKVNTQIGQLSEFDFFKLK